MERWVDKLFEAGEKLLLIIIAGLTCIAVALELITLGSELRLELADLLYCLSTWKFLGWRWFITELRHFLSHCQF